MSDLLYRLSSWRLLLLIMLAYGFFLARVMTPQAAAMAELAGPWGAPDGHFFYTPDQLYAALASWSVAAKHAYVDFRLGLDPVWALIYGSFLLVAASLALRSAAAQRPLVQRANLIGAAPMCADLLENLIGIALVTALPDRLDALAVLAAAITALKWGTLVLAHIVLLLATGAAVWRRVQRRLKKT